MKFYVSKKTIIFRLAVAVFLIALSVIGLGAVLPEFPEKPIICTFVILFNLCLFVVSFSMLRKDWENAKGEQALLEITEAGFIDHRRMRKLLEWGNVEWRTVTSRGSTNIVFKVLKDEDRYMNKMNFVARFGRGLGNLLGIPPYTVDLFSLSAKAEDVVSEFEKHKERI